jgi:hypothetical protein
MDRDLCIYAWHIEPTREALRLRVAHTVQPRNAFSGKAWNALG